MSQRYDHRLRNTVATSGNPNNLFKNLGIPRTTIQDWLRKGPVEVITLPEFEFTDHELITENQRLKDELEQATAKSDVVVKVNAILGFQLQYHRVPTSSIKTKIIRAIQLAARSLKLSTCLELLGMSNARYHAWLRRQAKCGLTDESCCPKISPTGLMPIEISKIEEMVSAPEFKHFSITSLALFAKKCGEVVASPATWSRVIKKLGLRRPRQRIYPHKPKLGIRASAPCQIWHLDQSVIKTEDGTRCFIQAIIDNFSRYVLAWSVSTTYGGQQTKELILRSIEKTKEFGFNVIPNVYVDSGTENLNENVDSLIDGDIISRTIAQIEIDFSNSLIESLFHRLKNKHLYFQQLVSLKSLTQQTDFYLSEANTKIPLAVLKGATPLEMLSGEWNETNREEFLRRSSEVRQERLEWHRSLSCSLCPG